MRAAAFLLLAVGSSGCTLALLSVSLPASRLAPHKKPAGDYRPPVALEAFGGPGGAQRLGCLDCGPEHPESIHNPAGPHGSPTSALSMRNRAGEFGSLDSPTSPCSLTATHPPKVVNHRGQDLGVITSNEAHPRRDTRPWFLDWLADLCRPEPEAGAEGQ